MSPDDIRDAVLACLTAVAPEADPATLDPKARLRDTLDLDSMDFLNFVVGLAKRLHVEVPEADYRQLTTLDNCVAYFAAKVPAAAQPSG